MRMLYNSHMAYLWVNSIVLTLSMVFDLHTVSADVGSPTNQKDVDASDESALGQQTSEAASREQTSAQVPHTGKRRLSMTEWWELRDARTLYDRSSDLLDEGWPIQARELLADATSSVKEHYGDKSCEYGLCLNLLARINCRLEEYEQAETTLESARDIMDSHVDDDYWDGVRLGIKINLALTMSKLKQFRSGESLYLEVLEEIKAESPKTHAIIEVALGNLYLDMGDYVQAEKNIKEGYESITKHTKENEPAYIGAVVAMGKIHLQKEEFAECKEELLRALKLQQDHHPGNYLQYADIADYIVDLHISQGQFEAAGELLEDISTAKGLALGKDHPLVLKTNARLAELRSAKK